MRIIIAKKEQALNTRAKKKKCFPTYQSEKVLCTVLAAEMLTAGHLHNLKLIIWSEFLGLNKIRNFEDYLKRMESNLLYSDHTSTELTLRPAGFSFLIA